jgi:hypothetical protein
MDEEENPADLERRMRGRWILARRAPFNANRPRPAVGQRTWGGGVNVGKMEICRGLFW